MYQVISKKLILLIAGLLTLPVFCIWWSFIEQSGAIAVFSTAIKSASLVATVILWVGQKTSFVGWAARNSHVNKFLPDLDGRWRATLTSNWPIIADAFNLPEVDGESYADIKITVRLFTIRMQLDSDSEYSESDTVVVNIHRNSENGDISMHYIYDDKTPEPLPTDSGAHFGAANLKLKPKDDRQPYLDGHYWTNRNWEKGWNTAGRIIMWRLDDPSSKANR